MWTVGIEQDDIRRPESDDDGFEYVVTETYYCIVASSTAGKIYMLTNSYTSERARAEEELAALDHNPDTAPDAWDFVRTIYGSDAWGDEDEAELARFEAECFHEPCPDWARH